MAGAGQERKSIAGRAWGLVVSVALLLAAGPGASPARADAIGGLVFFGDSTLDDGARSQRLRVDWEPYNSGGTLIGDDHGRPSNGPRTPELLMNFDGLRQAGYLNYAHWGTLSGSNIGTASTGSAASSLIDDDGQIARYLDSVGGRVRADQVFVLRSGANDFSNFRDTSAATDISTSLANMAQAATSLAAAGANRIFILNYPLPVSPSHFDGVYINVGGSQERYMEPTFLGYNTALASLVSDLRGSTGRDVVLVDFVALYRYMFANPELFGIHPSTMLESCVDYATGITCDSDYAFSSAYDRLTWDGLHASRLASRFEAAFLYEHLMAPRVGLSMARAWSRLAALDFDRIAAASPRFAPESEFVPFLDVQRVSARQSETLAEGASDLSGITSVLGVAYGLGDRSSVSTSVSWTDADGVSQDGGKITSDFYALGLRADGVASLWGQEILGSFAVSAGLGLNGHKRTPALPSRTQARVDDVGARALSAMVRVESPVQLGWATIAPTAAFGMWDSHVDAWEERGAPEGLGVLASSVSQTVPVSLLGATMSSAWPVGEATVRPRVGARWRHQFAGSLGDAEVAMSGAPRFSQTGRGEAVGADIGFVDAGLASTLFRGIDLDLSYHRAFGAALVSEDRIGGSVVIAF